MSRSAGKFGSAEISKHSPDSNKGTSMLKIAMWDTRRNDAQKDFAGGMGVGMHPGGGGLRGRIVRMMYQRDYRPVALNFAYLGAVLKRLGHRVTYVTDRLVKADIWFFNPSLLTLDLERKAIAQVARNYPEARIFVCGSVAWALPEQFTELGAQVLKGEPEQLLYCWDEVMESDDEIIDVGSVQDLDDLPFPDWSLFSWSRFRIKYDFWKFPTALIQQSRGCTFKCNYCPYIMIESKTRFRSPESVLEEIRWGQQRYGFESFKFRDPLFGLNRKKALAVAEGIGKLRKKIQFSIETRIDLMKIETLQALRDAGLTAITVGIETPSEDTLRKYSRQPINDDKQREFVARCREMGIRTVAGFMVGFPEDTEASIMAVMDYARRVNPTYANFNIVTPYPGTRFFELTKNEIADFDYSRYSVYQPVLKYRNLTPQQVSELHARCFNKFYFRSRYLADNARLLWPQLNRFGRQAPSETRRAA
jgi:radical SAM superfamily enzyme YgiQ (UPF0313 family)